MRRNKTYFITGGKTGGHIYPAVSIARELLSRNEEVYYVGNRKNLEYEICEREGFTFLDIDVDAMPRKIGLNFIKWGVKNAIASIVATKYILKYKPDAVFATGGFVCAPTLIAAIILKVPYMLHDCDACPGLVTKAFAKKAKSVSVAFRDAICLIKNKNTVFRGNPIREDFFTMEKSQARQELGLKEKITILIMGGSQGAKSICDAAIGTIGHFKDSPNIQIILQTGVKNYDDTLAKLGNIPQNTLIRPYFNDMALPLVSSDVAVSRAGSLSISELCACGLPSILIPYPHSAADHQKRNAQKMEELGAALFLDDKDCSSDNLIDMINEIILNPNKLSTMQSCAAAEAKPNATKEITEELMKVARK